MPTCTPTRKLTCLCPKITLLQKKTKTKKYYLKSIKKMKINFHSNWVDKNFQILNLLNRCWYRKDFKNWCSTIPSKTDYSIALYLNETVTKTLGQRGGIACSHPVWTGCELVSPEFGLRMRWLIVFSSKLECDWDVLRILLNQLDAFSFEQKCDRDNPTVLLE